MAGVMAATKSMVDERYLDLSGTALAPTANSYEALIQASSGDASQIQARYELHRQTRAKQQREKLLAHDFAGVIVDQQLQRLMAVESPPWEDPRHCLVFWARPSEAVRLLIGTIQRRMRAIAPRLWTMPQECLHMTVLELAHSLDSSSINELEQKVMPAVAEITDYPFDHRARLIKPSISFDAFALALSFVPAAGEGVGASGDSYTYHHLRRDVYELAQNTGVEIASRYVVPSSHLTIARFVDTRDFETDKGNVDHEKVAEWVAEIDQMNQWLEQEYWPSEANDGIPPGGEWIVGEGKGLVCRKGTVWYGGGSSVREGRGF